MQRSSDGGQAGLSVQRVSYDACSPARRADVEQAHSRAMALVNSTLQKLWSYRGDDRAVAAALQKHFHTDSAPVARMVADGLNHVRQMAWQVQYECHENEYDGQTLAWSMWCVPFADILVYQLFFDESNVDKRANTLVHEWLHKYLCLFDLGYDFEPEYASSSTLRALFNAEPYGNLVAEIGP